MQLSKHLAILVLAYCSFVSTNPIGTPAAQQEGEVAIADVANAEPIVGDDNNISEIVDGEQENAGYHHHGPPPCCDRVRDRCSCGRGGGNYWDRKPCDSHRNWDYGRPWDQHDKYLKDWDKHYWQDWERYRWERDHGPWRDHDRHWDHDKHRDHDKHWQEHEKLKHLDDKNEPKAALDFGKRLYSERNQDLDVLIQALTEYKSYRPGSSLGKRDLTEDLTSINEFMAQSKIPVMDSILSIMDRSGLVTKVTDLILSDPELLDLTIDTTILIIQKDLINLADVLIAIQKSGLILDILRLSLEDPEILPGLLRIGMEIMSQSGLDDILNNINIFGKRDEMFDHAKVDTPIVDFGTVSTHLDKRENKLLNLFFQSFRDSGIAVSLVRHILVSPKLASANAHFMLLIINSGALPPTDLLKALKESNLIWRLFKDLLADPGILKEFGSLVADRVMKGLIPFRLFEAAALDSGFSDAEFAQIAGALGVAAST